MTENHPDDESPLNGSIVSDTIPPTAEHHGWLEQFETLTFASFGQLRDIVESGLQTTERVMLMKVALNLFTLAVHKAEALESELTQEQKDEITSLVAELETKLHLVP